MGDWQLKGVGQRYSMIGQDILARPKAVYPSLSANTKGLWTELEASTSIDATAITVMIPYVYGGSDYLVDIGIGPAGAEQTLISNLIVSIGTTSYGDKSPVSVRIPVHIAAGTRVSARCQATGTTASRMIRCGLLLELNIAPLGGRLVTEGANTADSGGASIDPGVADNTKGAWAQITASTAADVCGVFFAFGNQVNTSRTDCFWLVDIGIGGAGAEQIAIPNIPIAMHSYTTTIFPCITPFYELHIPAGTRVAARASCTITDATDRLFDIIMYGLS